MRATSSCHILPVQIIQTTKPAHRNISPLLLVSMMSDKQLMTFSESTLPCFQEKAITAFQKIKNPIHERFQFESMKTTSSMSIMLAL